MESLRELYKIGCGPSSSHTMGLKRATEQFAERNNGVSANVYAALSDRTHLVSYDKVVDVMMEIGHNLPSLYRETSEGGLAKRCQPR